MALFNKGNNVNFKRNKLVFGNNIPIVAVVEKYKPEEEQKYILENSSYGWPTSSIRKKRFGLQDNKKYLFVNEGELTAV